MNAREISRKRGRERWNEQRAKKISDKGTDLRKEEAQFTALYDGGDYRRVTGDRGGYTFHHTYGHPEVSDLKLAHKYLATVQEQLNDPTFLMEWKVYEKWNQRAKEVYRLRVESDIPRKACEQEEAA